MSTFMANNQTVERKWYIIDAKGKPMGRLAAECAHILNGKHKTDYTPHVDCGDNVIVINAAEVVLTGKKLDQKKYYHHSGWVGGLKEVKYSTLMKEKPEKAMLLAVKGMLPDTVIGRKALTRCRVFQGAEHKHAAQQPQAWEL